MRLVRTGLNVLNMTAVVILHVIVQEVFLAHVVKV